MAKTDTKGTKVTKVSNPTGAESSNTGFILAIAAILVVGIAGVALAVSFWSGGESRPSQQTGEIAIGGDGLAPLSSGTQISTPEDDPTIGTTAPTLTGSTFDGQEVTIEADGNPKVVYFLAHWCPHCQNEVPIIQELIDAGSVPDGLDIYAVSTSVDAGQGNYPPAEWFETEGFTPTVIRDDAENSALIAYGGSSFPYTVYLDGDNNVIARSAGELGSASIAAMWEQTAAAAG